MNEYKDIGFSLLKRSLIAVPFFVLGFFVLFHAQGGLVGGFAMGLLGCGAIIVGAIVIAFPLARLIAEPSGSLFLPKEHFDRPQPRYGIPQSKRAQGLYEEAMAGFEKIAEEYPGEVKPYIEMIDIAIVNLKDPQRAYRIYQRGISTLKKREDRDVVVRMYEAIRSRLDTKPSN
jgi:hypothetical protein